jgi:phosphoenolpyruvate carboxykinase (GTP)
MGDYFQHWLHMQQKIANPPKNFMVNWYRQDKQGKFVWPGFGENMRVLKWIVDRARGVRGGQETVVGWVPRPGDLDLSGLDISDEALQAATEINVDEWKREVEDQKEFFDKIGDRMPKVLSLYREVLLERLKDVGAR